MHSFLQTARIPIAEVYGDLGRLPDAERLLGIPPNPNIRVFWLPDCGHYLSLEKPQFLAGWIRRAIE